MLSPRSQDSLRLDGITRRTVVMALLLLLVLPSGFSAGTVIRSLLTGQVDEVSSPLIKWFKEEPLIDAHSVPTRPGGLVDEEDIKRFVRIYFPRSYPSVEDFDFIMLHSPVMSHLHQKHAKWMYDAIKEGAGALSAPSCMSVLPEIHEPWINSILSDAFPSDCARVLAAGGPMGKVNFRIIVNRNFPEPVLTPFIPLGIERFVGYKAYLIIPRDGVAILARQTGSFDEIVPYMVSWDYDQGRAMTIGDSFGLQFWSAYAHGHTDNPYGLDILMNLVLYVTRNEIPAEPLILHKMRLSFVEFRTRMSLLLSMIEFAESLGANEERVQQSIGDLESGYSEAKGLYLSCEFQESEQAIESVLADFGEVEREVLKLKDNALLWVYMVEWLVITGTFMICSFVIWSFMVKRRLYREVEVTSAERRAD